MKLLNYLEEEAIYIIREVAAQFQRPSLLFSGGKDSIVLSYLAKKAFLPGSAPFDLVHIDTGHNFQEALDFRDRWVAKHQFKLKVYYVQDDIDNGRVREEKGPGASRNQLQTTTLLRAIETEGYDACLGGARRDEEKARAKERIFSVRDDFGQWNEKAQRPELFDLLNGSIHKGENVRAFPLSNWTELDVWEYIRQEAIKLPSLYFAHQREVVLQKGQYMPYSELLEHDLKSTPESRWVRFRTVGDMSCTAAVLSQATTLDQVIAEIAQSNESERGARIDDKRSEGAMEERKKVGYF
jgi:sulfate adenylyltransferase subunit 2